MRKPNLFLVGAPKCGTTSLYNYLLSHEDIFFPEIKEPHFFNTDSNNVGNLADVNGYLRKYKSAKAQQYLGDASTHYLMSIKAPENIKLFCPEAKIVIMLRRPVDLLFSAFVQNTYNGIESEKSLTEALEKEKNDARLFIKLSNAERLHLQYSRFTRFSEYVNRYFEIFGRDNVHVIIFDDFISDTEKEFNRVINFLGLSVEDFPSFNVFNSAKASRVKVLQKLLNRPPKVLHLLGATLPKWLRGNILKTLRKMNSGPSKTKPLSIEDVNNITVQFSSEVEALEGLLNRDLMAWRGVQ